MAIDPNQLKQQLANAKAQVAKVQAAKAIKTPVVTGPKTTGIAGPKVSTPTFTAVKNSITTGTTKPLRKITAGKQPDLLTKVLGALNSVPAVRDLGERIGRINPKDVGILGDSLEFVQEGAKKMAHKVASGQGLDLYGDLIGPNISKAIQTGGPGTLLATDLLFGQEQGKDIRRGIAQAVKPLTFGLASRIPGFEEMNTPQTNAGKVTGGISEALGFLTGAGLAAPLLGKVAGGATNAVQGLLGTSKAAQLAASLAPHAVTGFALGAANAPAPVKNEQTGEYDYSIGSFLDPKTRLAQGLSQAGAGLVGGGAGMLTSKAIGGLNLPTTLARVVSGLSGGGVNAATAYAQGERDPAKLITQFGVGTAFGAMEPGQTREETIQAPKQENVPKGQFKTEDGLLINRDYQTPTGEDNLVVKLQNKFKPLEDLGLSNKVAVREYLGSEGQAKAQILEGLKPILQDNGIAGDAIQQFEVYSAAKRNQALAERGLKGATEIYYEKEGLLGKAKSVPVPEEIPNNPQFEQAFQALQSYQSSLLDQALQAGTISQELYNSVKSTGDYVPFQRHLEEETGGVGKSSQLGSVSKQNILQKYKGSDKAILSPLESIINNTVATQELINRNQVAKTTIDSLTALQDQTGQPLIERVKETKGLNQDEYISVLENGEKVIYKVPEDIGRAAKNLPNEQMNILTKVLSAPARILRQGATSANIDFMIPNVLRDQFNAAINSQFGYTPFKDYVSGLKSYITGDESYQNFLKSGAEVSFGLDSGDLLKEISRPADKNLVSTFTRKIKEYTNPLNIIKDLGEVSEVGTRVGLYKNAVARGASPEQAMLEARTATSDFSVRGSQSGSVASVIPFLNARVQGFDSSVQAFKNNPVKFSTMTALYAVLPTIVMQAALNSTPVGSQISSYDKDKYYIIPLKGSASTNPEDFAKVPKPEIAQWLNPLRKAFETLQSGGQVNPALVAADVLGSASPVGGLTVDQQKGNLNVDLSGFMPQAIRPLVEAGANYDFFRQRPVVPYYKLDRPEALQYTSGTDPLFIELGKQLGFSPAKLQQIAYGYTAGVGQQVAQGVGGLTGLNDQYTKDARPGASLTAQTPILRRILGIDLNTPQEQKDQMQYEIKDLVYKIKDTGKAKDVSAANKKAAITGLKAQLKALQDQQRKQKATTFAAVKQLTGV